jgi:GWxTD domain-containing protein
MRRRSLFIILIPFIILLSYPQARRVEKESPDPASYLFTDKEQKVFFSLNSTAERNRFFKEFWWLHDPDLTTPANELKLELDRRVSFANRYFGKKGSPGWTTDKGIVYIILGPPSEVERNPKATRDSPKEVWIYRNHLGRNDEFYLVIDFFDSSGEGELTLPSLIRKRLATPETFPSPQKSILSIGTRWQGIKLTHYPKKGVINSGLINRVHEERTMASEIHLTRLTSHLSLPPAKFFLSPYRHSSPLKPLLKKDFFRLGKDTVLAPVTLGIYYRDCLYKLRGKMSYATLDIHLLIMDEKEQLKTEDGVKLSYGLSEKRFHNLSDELIYIQFPLILDPGSYTMILLVKDCLSNRLIYQAKEKLRVSDLTAEKLALSSLILSRRAEEIKEIQDGEWGVTAFTLANYKIDPNLKMTFYSRGHLNLFYEIYNLRLDRQKKKNSCRIEYLFFRDGRFHSKAPTYFLPPSSQRDQSVLTRFRLKNFLPGNYTLQVLVRDQVANKSVSSKISFTIK